MKKEKQPSECRLKTSIGGQALMEGIMMRGPKMTALAVRNTKGEIVVEEFETKGVKRPAVCRLPIIRGVFGYIDSMVTGYKCLMRSAELAGLEDIVEEKPKKKKKDPVTEPAAEPAETDVPTEKAEESVPGNAADTAPEQKADPAKAEEADGKPAAENGEDKKLPAWTMTAVTVVSLILGFALAIGLFVYLPAKLYSFVQAGVPFLQDASPATASICKSVFEGILKIILLVGYMAVISLMKDIRRTFMYHGAEHKTIFCYEAGLELTVENIRKQRRFHPRCGTSFLIIMILVSIFISFFIDPISIAVSGAVLPIALRVTVKLLLIPLIVGIGYEMIKFAGRHDNWFTRVISAPGMWLQHITVFEPTDDMIECAIAAVERVIPDDGSDRW